MRDVRSVFVEALLLAVIGLAFALIANEFSPRGLRLTRNYFPEIKMPAAVAKLPADGGAANHQPAENATNAAALRLQERGLQLASAIEVFELFRDPNYEQGLIVFVDARDDEHFAAGHIPGAWQLNHYRPENYLPAVLPACLAALKVVVYCTGGQCEDSEFTAIMLRDAGIQRESLFVYAGGITEWTALGRTIETGARGSGQLVTSPTKP